MQKKLLGMAVAAALAAPGLVLAQSAVQVYGTVHMSASSARFSADTLGNPSQSKMDVNSHSSNWGLRSTETVGGGMTAWFQAEFNMPMLRENGTGNTAGTSRNSGVGLRGGFGNIYVGTWETPMSQTFRLWDVGTIGGYGPTTTIIGRRETTSSGRAYNCGGFVTANGGQLPDRLASGSGTICGNVVDGAPALGGAGTGAGANLGYPVWRRYTQSIFYESPLFEGVQLKLAYQPNENKSDYAVNGAAPANAAGATTGVNANPSSWSGSLTWTGLGGRARAFIATMQAKDFSQVGQTDGGWSLGGGYDFGVANVGAVYETYKYKPAAGEFKAKEYAVGIAVPMGPGKIGASWAKAKELEGSGVVAATNDTKATMWNLGYEWALSKRTQLGFGYAKIDNGANVAFTWSGHTVNPNGATNSSVNAGTDQSHLFVSMRHSF